MFRPAYVRLSSRRLRRSPLDCCDSRHAILPARERDGPCILRTHAGHETAVSWRTSADSYAASAPPERRCGKPHSRPKETREGRNSARAECQNCRSEVFHRCGDKLLATKRCVRLFGPYPVAPHAGYLPPEAPLRDHGHEEGPHQPWWPGLRRQEANICYGASGSSCGLDCHALRARHSMALRLLTTSFAHPCLKHK